MNALVGHESDLTQDVTDPKTIIVIGGGPAGLEAARVAGKRGHDVTLYEKERELGGQLVWAKHAPAKREYEELLTFFRAELDAYDVTVQCDTEISQADIDQWDADHLLIATGSAPRIPPIEGLSDATRAGIVVLAEEVLTGDPPEETSVVVYGGTEVACDTAEYLAERDVDVTIVSRDTFLANRITREYRHGMRDQTMDRLEANPRIDLLSDARLDKINQDTVTVLHNGDEHRLDCDRVVIATEHESTRAFSDLDTETPTRTIGDADSPRDLHTAIHEGAEVGLSL